ncbi:MAG: TIM barrel protein [Bacteroidetes bacterium]|nr:TIM barrel protein [Bacteroidota bacterium]MBS1744593.1 TIM barrel protein [Bacteroidota bacterium]
MKTSRKDFILNAAMVTAGLAYSCRTTAGIDAAKLKSFHPSAGNEQGKICVFSKHFQELGYNELAAVVAEMGFDGIDLTVRPEGHVLPENVERDLPLAVEAAKKSGLKIYMIATAIVDADDKYTEPVLKTASSLGIRHYRMGPRHYDEKKSVPQNLTEIKASLKKLGKLNRKYNIHGECQNHYGDGFGSTVWDIWEVLKEMDPEWVGVQYDVYHATVEGAHSWPLGFQLVKPYIGTMDIKDFYWKKNDKRWQPQSVPLGEGMVDYEKFIALLKENKMNGPFSIHNEYLSLTDDLSAKSGKIKQDLITLRKWLREAGLLV